MQNVYRFSHICYWHFRMKKTYLTFKQIIPTLAAFMTSAVIVAQEVAIYRSVEIELTTQSGLYYQLESSEDFQAWKPVGSPFLGRGHVQSQFLRVENQHIFYRVKPIDATPSAEEDAVFQYSENPQCSCSRPTLPIPHRSCGCPNRISVFQHIRNDGRFSFAWVCRKYKCIRASLAFY